MKIIAIIQARLNSLRYPNKVLEKINNKSVIEILLKRLKKSKKIHQIIVATTNKPIDDKLENEVLRLGFNCFRGSENHVLKRYVDAATAFNGDIIVRITGDCPLIDPKIVDECIDLFLSSDEIDYCSNAIPPSFPDGLDVEVMKLSDLKKILNNNYKKTNNEYITSHLIKSKRYKKVSYKNDVDLSHLRLTLDEPIDLKLLKKIFEYFKPSIYFSWDKILNLYKKKPSLFDINRNIQRNEGQNKSSGQKLWKRAKRVIPGGNMLLSKRPDLFLPDSWPVYFSKSKACNIWDLDGKKYTDMCIMGIGTNTLGYGNKDVDEAVRKTVFNGNVSTFNCPEEVFLAEKLIELHPWADMVKFARTGGEANAVAVRIARAACGNNKVALCGYHGWHDWYLSANLNNKTNLDQHLLPGLKTKGVPNNLKDTVFPFMYNDLDGLKKIIKQHKVGIIKMEVERSVKPKNNFLKKVRELADKNKIILIFDECTSGFRETYGGLHKKYRVNPDILILGKALGNGYAITSVLGKREIMEATQSTFISSTFWTERIGPSAALKTLEIMEKEKSWKNITQKGERIMKGWKKLARVHNVEITTFGIPALASFQFKNKNAEYKTLISQEMLKKGFLAATSIYVCVEHTTQIIEKYFEELYKVFKIIGDCEKGADINQFLKSPICKTTFDRLN